MARFQKSQDWFVVQTHYQCEGEAKRHLSRQGFEAEYPMIRLQRNTKGERPVRPLFEGYVFVRECAAWHSIRGTRGVAQLLMGCDRPRCIVDEEFQFFLSGSVDEAGYYVDPAMRVFKVGDVVRPRFGRFGGIPGRLEALDSRGRVQVLYSLLGRAVRQEFRVTDLT